ncbi:MULTISPECIES: DNA-3-methyladenine glycosylase I [Gordonia]|uniref:DNA-3-methyladenine glycosylase I n=2 Tax=Gordonia terrae TaxID=2055 RepID=A0AAD0KA33_9ACTN|nr:MULTISPECIES: DNA-3-methyladenine glycosylase I [Gordonia]VTR07814.1 DNA-3-methyladenine glycosylase I [Clostridioides difficile]ANY24980.1 3-methyladenine DNA glycosylase [Gordonia terrae]AWO85730.1 DNA-3-methyladenine glycosylase I [Gordonia terrae]VTS61136.1 DNA-3-methyladenine glycosylase 1 [Gordonia terrae]GAB44453.1 3-methyladenine-DNA glycosylase I [Gordonia terrae NBRC 100016]
MPDDTITIADGRARCLWAAREPETTYHDTEWGFPIAGDTALFERVCLEGFQSGLSWRTILTKRENFRAAFAGFDIEQVARFADADVTRLLADAGIIRHRGKIEASINNARRAIELIDEHGSLESYFWGYAPAGEHEPGSMTTSPESVALSKDLKKRGWRFVGPTTMFALMQATGMVNDHAYDCVIRADVDAALRAAYPQRL